ncbi:hypothetical protein [Hydrogenimonas sp.]
MANMEVENYPFGYIGVELAPEGIGVYRPVNDDGVLVIAAKGDVIDIYEDEIFEDAEGTGLYIYTDDFERRSDIEGHKIGNYSLLVSKRLDEDDLSLFVEVWHEKAGGAA